VAAGAITGAGTRQVRASCLIDFATSILTGVGMRVEDAKLASECLVEANLSGVDGHGVMRLPQYVSSITRGAINLEPVVRVVRASGATALLDADGGYGFAPTRLAVDMAISLAHASGIGAVGVTNSHHFGMAALYVRRAAASRCIGICTTNGRPVLAPPGGLSPVVSNNPVAIGVPRDDADAPFVVDLAFSESSWGKISLAAAEGRSIPNGWAFDRAGRHTTNPADALASEMLAPIGGHKGYALALALDALAGALTGSNVGASADGHGSGCGHLVIAVDPSFLAGNARFKAGMRSLADDIYAVPLRGGGMAHVPGDGAAALRVERAAKGIPISQQLLTSLNGLANELGLKPL
jgi:LDH2 family malate/lactate/ureidoglycolate dehydrogenase